jgi:hypothetical protein
MFTWDNYTRELVKGWSRLGMSACEISLAWPWEKKPTGQDVLKLQRHALEQIERQSSWIMANSMSEVRAVAVQINDYAHDARKVKR